MEHLLLNSRVQDFSVAVVIPAYNCEQSIDRAVQSVMDQTVPVDKIIIVDDGSSDRTVEVVRKLEQQFDCVHLIEQTNGGPAKARNTGIKSATSQWIAFLDADDAWLPNRLESQKSIIDAHPGVNWASGAFTRIKFNSLGKKVTVGESPKSPQLNGKPDGVFDALAEITNGTSVWTGCMLIKRDELIALDGFDNRFKVSEDIDLWVRLAIRNPQIGFVTTSIALYTIDQAGSLVGKNARSLDLTNFTFYERLIEIAGQSTGNTKFHLQKLLGQKIQSYTDNLLRTGRSDTATEFIKLLKSKNMPLPRLASRVLASIPNQMLKIIRSWILMRRSRKPITKNGS